jgi:hypothetical protein
MSRVPDRIRSGTRSSLFRILVLDFRPRICAGLSALVGGQRNSSVSGQPCHQVAWTNEDSAPPTATGDEFEAGMLKQGDAGSVTFDTPGTYE